MMIFPAFPFGGICVEMLVLFHGKFMQHLHGNFMHIQVSHEEKKLLLSMNYWLFDRDAYVIPTYLGRKCHPQQIP